MTASKYLVEIWAEGEVRDHDGNLISRTPVHTSEVVDEQRAIEIASHLSEMNQE